MKSWGHETGQEIDSPGTRLKSLEFHEEITELIESGESVRASDLMEQHIRTAIRSVQPDRLDQRVDPTVIRLDW